MPLRQVNQVWLEGRVKDLSAMIHPEGIVGFPGLGALYRARHEGRDRVGVYA
jgi:hypothetical protein